MKTNSLKPNLRSRFNVRCARFPLTAATPPAAPRSPRGFRLSVFCFLLFVGYASAATRYVWQESPSPGPPYDTWTNAAQDIQTAVDAAVAGDEIVVTNGIYATGGRAVGTNVLANRVAVDKPVALRSVNGPEFTIIEGAKAPGGGNGDGAIRCVYLADGASVSGFTLTNGATRTTYDYPKFHESGGGGVWCESTNVVVSNCVLTGNSAGYWGGGGAYSGTLNNCTLTGNSAFSGGGARESTLNNCIIYFNDAPDRVNYSEATLNYCCTTPMPAGGTSNITDDPQLASASRLSASSPCRSAGRAVYASGTDIDGESWATPPSIGCDEYHAGAVTGPLSVSIASAYTNVAAGYELGFTALIEGRTAVSVWDFGDGTVVSNRPYASHSWATAGDYAVVLRAYNKSHPHGVSATMTVHVVETPVHYVELDSANPQPPYTSWATAATNIQDAVDAATVPGSLVLVSNGVYATGGRVVFDSVTNRAAVTKPVMLRSVNGPEVTVIDGGRSVRCVYLADGASLSGFTVTKGGSPNKEGGGEGGGVRCESAMAVVSNCVLTANSASWGGGAYGGMLNNCVLIGNSARAGMLSDSSSSGGGACQCTLNNCTLIGNEATGGWYIWSSEGGGASGCILNNCTLTGNSADNGGGADSCTLNNCTLTGNSAVSSCAGGMGGGAYGGTLYNCTLTGNSAYNAGGGACGSTLNNCMLTGNSASWGGGVGYKVGSQLWPTLNNCTLTGNSADYGGGAYDATLNNCILYFNTAPIGANHLGCTLNYCCTTPMPAGGAGNITDDPQLASASHLSAASPCRGAGSAAYASGTDIDGEPWATPPSIGCDEYHPGEVTGPLVVNWSADRRAVTPGHTVSLTAFIQGRASASVWDFGDGVVVSNQPYAGHPWTTPGDYAVVLRAYNDSHPEGVSATGMIYVAVHPVLYVAVDSAHPSPPYSSWATAARTIQEAVDVTVPGAEVVVSNGWYGAGGRDGNRVCVDRQLWLRSVNGPGWTVIDGGGTARGVFLAGGARLSGFTVTNGTAYIGGGLSCESATAAVSNCVLTGNRSAASGGGGCGGTLYNCTLTGNEAYAYGGGAAWSVLNNCTLTANSASYGGGAYDSTLNNCTLTGNWADWGGGAYGGTLSNCILYFNTATHGANHFTGINQWGWEITTLLNYSCTTPLPTNGLGNITADPRFVNTNNWSDLRLQPNSPCINAGNNDYVTTTTDLDGNPRTVGGRVDIGAYEFNPNVAPVADASATRPVVISPNGVDATVILDGSRASDPDGDLLQYLWFLVAPQSDGGGSTLLATGVVAVVQLPAGVHPILLVVNDGLATATNSITIEVITPAQAVQRLIGQVESSWPRSRPLVASLSAALRSIERGNSVPAINQLQAFQHKVSAQVGPSDPTLAATFTATAQEIIEALSGGQTNPGGRPHGRLTAVKHHSNGHVQLQFMAERGAVCIVEASTDLVHWQKIGVAADHGDGTFEFEDPNAAKFPHRFYRIVPP